MSKEEQRRRCYAAIENGCSLNQFSLTGKGTTLEQINKLLPDLSKSKNQNSLTWLKFHGVVVKCEKSGYIVREVPPGFCWIHGLQYTDLFGLCTKCEGLK